jgi:hypothetical protein
LVVPVPVPVPVPVLVLVLVPVPVFVVVPVPVFVVVPPLVVVPVPLLAALDGGLGVEFGFIEPDPELDPQAASTTMALTGTKDVNFISRSPWLCDRTS